MKLENIQYGFIYGPVTVTRLCSDDKKGWVALGVKTAKHKHHGIQIYVTKSGKIRIFNEDSKELKIKEE